MLYRSDESVSIAVLRSDSIAATITPRTIKLTGYIGQPGNRFQQTNGLTDKRTMVRVSGGLSQYWANSQKDYG